MADSKTKLHGKPSKRTLDLGEARIKRMRVYASKKELEGTHDFKNLSSIANELMDVTLDREGIPIPPVSG